MQDDNMNKPVETITEEFFSKYRTRRYAKGQILILNGDTTDVVYYVVSGRVKQYDISYRGEEIILNVFKSPAFFPMSLVLTDSDNPYTYEAETDIEVRQAPALEVIEFLKAHPEVTLDLLSRVYRGIDGLLGRMAQLMAGSAHERLMYELIVACKRYGEVHENGSATLVMREADLGSRAGLSRETVSREINKLVDERLITFEYGTIHINHLAILEEKLGHSV